MLVALGASDQHNTHIPDLGEKAKEEQIMHLPKVTGGYKKKKKTKQGVENTPPFQLCSAAVELRANLVPARVEEDRRPHCRGLCCCETVACGQSRDSWGRGS